jgi:hypothetical protein
MNYIIVPDRKKIAKEIEKMRQASKEICRTKESARKFLFEHGYIDKNGKLSKKYR